MLWPVKANTRDEAAAKAFGIRSVEECSCCVSPQQLKLSRSWSRQAARLCDKVTLPTFQGLWHTEAASHRCRAPDALLFSFTSSNPGRRSKQKEGKQECCLLFFFIRCTRRQWSGNKDVSSQRTVLFYIWSGFLLDSYWEGWGIATPSHSPQEGNLIRQILSEDALQSHLDAKKQQPGKQLQPSSSSSSWVTVVTGPTNPLTHLLDCYLALDSISWVWLGGDKGPLLRLWYRNERDRRHMFDSV